MDKIGGRGPETVMLGLDGHLFERDEETIERLTGMSAEPETEVDRWVQLLTERHAWCSARGIHFYFVITPEKHVVYADKLPPGVEISPHRLVARILARLPAAVRQSVIYSDDVLRDWRDRGETYYRTDTHWTNFGAYLGYLQLLAALQRDSGVTQMPITTLERTTYHKIGDLGIRMTPEHAETATRITLAGGDPFELVFANRTYNVGQVEVFETSDATRPRAVMFRDSSGSFMLPFLASSFSRLVAVASDSLFFDLLEAEKPNVVITQLTERVIGIPIDGAVRFPDDHRPIDFARFSGVPLPLPTRARNFVDTDFSDQGEKSWSVGPHTEIILSCRVPYAACVMMLTVSPYLHPPQVTSQRLTIVVNHRQLGTFEVTAPHQTISCPVPLGCLFSPRTIRVEFFHPDGIAPQSLGDGDDTRPLGIRFEHLAMRQAG